MPPKRGRPAVKAVEESTGQDKSKPRKGRTRAAKEMEELKKEEEMIMGVKIKMEVGDECQDDPKPAADEIEDVNIKIKEEETDEFQTQAADVEMEAADGDDKKSKNKPEKKADREVSKAKSNRLKRKNDSADVKEPTAKKSKSSVNKTETNPNEIDRDSDKENAEDKRVSIKICSWNVSGIRALLNRNGFDYLIQENADIIALQETRCALAELPDDINIPGYEHKYLESTGQTGFFGIAVYSKEKFISVTEGINDPELDKEGRMLTIEYPNFYFVNVDVPHVGNKLKRMEKRVKFDELFLKRVKELDAQKPVIICGDMNVAHKEIDLNNPYCTKKRARFTRKERQGMTNLLDSGFVDVFRHLYPDKKGAYTFWSHMNEAREKNAGWRLDYFIVSDRIKNNVCDTVIRDKVYGSEHCPIILFANF